MERTAKCLNCQVKKVVSELHKLESASGCYKFICTECTRKLYGYHEENQVVAHDSKAHKLTFSFEYEQGSRSLQSNILYEYGFIPTYDGTVAVEWKSPIYQSLCGIMKQLRTMEKIDDTDYSCGTHLNAGMVNSAHLRMDCIRRHYLALFKPLENYLRTVYGGDALERIFGRNLGGTWADYIDTRNAMEHCNWINLQHDTHIECRLPKFQSAEQYMLLIKWWTQSVNLIVENFSDKCTSSTTKAEDEKQADATAQKLIKLFDKYFEFLR